jgi:hypothetical protein
LCATKSEFHADIQEAQRHLTPFNYWLIKFVLKNQIKKNSITKSSRKVCHRKKINGAKKNTLVMCFNRV